jgi:outer membrane immunogenic protein
MRNLFKLIFALVLTATAIHIPKSFAQYNCNPHCWNGLYLGINGGYSWDNIRYDFLPNGNGGDIFAPDSNGGFFRQRIHGGLLGGHLGFNVQMANVVLGLEGSAARTWLEKKSNDVFGAIAASYETDLTWFATATPRFGIAMDNVMPYVKGGFVAWRVNSQLNSLANGATPREAYDQQKHHIGWTAGGGVEYLVNPHVILGLEYNYYDLQKLNYDGRTKSSRPVIYSIHPTFNAVVARISYKL